jgi:hypothetical protein
VPAAPPTTAHFPAVNASLRNVFHVLQQQYLNAPRSLGASGADADTGPKRFSPSHHLTIYVFHRSNQS